MNAMYSVEVNLGEKVCSIDRCIPPFDYFFLLDIAFYGCGNSFVFETLT
jgi:hypothetical protein